MRLSVAVALLLSRAAPTVRAFSGPSPHLRAALSAYAARPSMAAGRAASLRAEDSRKARARETELLALTAQGDAAATLRAFEALEQLAPAPTDLLTSAPELLDGRWSLLSTITATVGEDASQGQSAVVNASGIIVDAARDTLPVQEVRVERGRIGNEIVVRAPLGQQLYVRVAGALTSQPPPAPGNRAFVSFDSLEVFQRNGRRILSAGWVFSLVQAIKPALMNGDSDSSWLDTTYISDRVRLGRGNKGSIFILERLQGDGTLPPLP